MTSSPEVVPGGSGARSGAWRKLGLVDMRGRPAWAVSHLALPIVDAETDGSLSVYFTSRDDRGRSQIGAGRFDLAGVPATLDPRALPVLQCGALGAFDDHGVTGACLVGHRSRKFLFYTGWTRGVTVPFYFYVGLAVSDDGGRTYARASRAPVLERTEIDPFLTASPWVLIEGGVWRMWYVSCVKWESTIDGPRHLYHVKYAESDDGVAWRRRGVVCIDFETPDEHAFGRPCVVKDAGGLYRMWYSHRGDRYRIGYAESRDGIGWSRKDHLAGVDVSASGWDSEMIEYPDVFDAGGRRYMLYNGNGYGASGMGLAVLTR